MFSSGRDKQRVPLGALQDGPTLCRIPGVLVQEAAQRTFADQLSAVQRRFGGSVQEHRQRSLQAALLVGRGWNGQELICQNADALPQNL